MQVSDFRRSIVEEADFINLIFSFLTLHGMRVFEDTYEPTEEGKKYLDKLGIMYFPTVEYFKERDVYYITYYFILKELKS